MKKINPSKRVHIATYFERRCKCGEGLSALAHDYGLLTWPELDGQLGKHNIPLCQLQCPKCGAVGWPECLVIYNVVDGGKEAIIREKIGTEGMPVVGDAPYAVVMSPGEQAEYDRGLEKLPGHYQEHKDRFWDDYCRWAMLKWAQYLKELHGEEYAFAYKEMGLPTPVVNPSVAAWRRDANRRFVNDDDRKRFWQLANRYLVEQEFIWVPIDSWPISEWVKEYGRKRITYLILHVPLPEELEAWRTKALGKVVRKRSGEMGVLFERIGQLGKELDKQRNRSVTLSRQLRESRQENASLAEQVGQLNRKLEAIKNRPKLVVRNTDDIHKIRALKGLIGELRDEVARLTGLLPEDEPKTSYDRMAVDDEPVSQADAEPSTVDRSVLDGKTIAVVGWPNEIIEDACRVVWHDGDGVDVDLRALVGDADIIVVLTRFISHGAMWWLKEAAIDMSKPIYFVRERNIDRILDVVAEKESPH